MWLCEEKWQQQIPLGDDKERQGQVQRLSGRWTVYIPPFAMRLRRMGHPFGLGCAKRKKGDDRSFGDDNLKGDCNSDGGGELRAWRALVFAFDEVLGEGF